MHAEVLPGQVWEDLSRPGRTFRVIRVNESSADVMTITRPGGEPIPSYLQRGTSITLRTLARRSTYQLLKETPDGN